MEEDQGRGGGLYKNPLGQEVVNYYLCFSDEEAGRVKVSMVSMWLWVQIRKGPGIC